MLLQWLWFFMMSASLLYALATGKAAGMLEAALTGTGNALGLSLRLCAGYLFFCGLIEIVKALRLPEKISRALGPLLHRLMPGLADGEARQAVCLNLTANLLGLGNAATPTGMEAVRLLDQAARQRPQARHAIYMLLILNATSIQLLPTTILSLRAAAGSAAPQAILLPTIACTCLSTLVGAGLGLGCMRWQEARHG